MRQLIRPAGAVASRRSIRPAFFPCAGPANRINGGVRRGKRPRPFPSAAFPRTPPCFRPRFCAAPSHSNPIPVSRLPRRSGPEGFSPGLFAKRPPFSVPPCFRPPLFCAAPLSIAPAQKRVRHPYRIPDSLSLSAFHNTRESPFPYFAR